MLRKTSLFAPDQRAEVTAPKSCCIGQISAARVPSDPSLPAPSVLIFVLTGTVLVTSRLREVPERMTVGRRQEKTDRIREYSAIPFPAGRSVSLAGACFPSGGRRAGDPRSDHGGRTALI